jgi:L-arabinose isomerase
MKDLKKFEAWFITGSQHLYGPETLKEVEEHSVAIVKGLNENSSVPVTVVFKPVLTTPESIYNLCLEANSAPNCIGLITWMHTFSPARMWIAGLNILSKPFVHLHTQYNRNIPWDSIDMDFMNLNQSAHGDREFGFICSRMKKPRKVIVGYWQDEYVINKLAVWMRAASARLDAQGARIARFGDNMRNVAVTEGDKVEAQIKMGYVVNGYGIGDLIEYINKVKSSETEQLLSEYEQKYDVAPELRRNGAKHTSLIEAAKIEAGIRNFLIDGDFKGLTTTFEDLHGLSQLPGLSVQRLMNDGYGFGAEGDWKTAALVRAMKVMAAGLHGGTSFMEDYTYHFDTSGMRVLSAHMLEVCESIAAGRPKLEVHPLSIGGKSDPPRLVFDSPAGEAINATLIDMGNRFRMIVNEVTAVTPDNPLPKLPVARVLLNPKPNLEVSAHAWILGGGAHHTGYSQAITAEYMEDFAEMMGLEFLLINQDTTIREFKKELNWNDKFFA